MGRAKGQLDFTGGRERGEKHRWIVFEMKGRLRGKSKGEMRWRKHEKQVEDNGRMVEEEVRCNVKEEGRRLERDKNGKMGHRGGGTDAVERGREEKREERKTERL